MKVELEHIVIGIVIIVLLCWLSSTRENYDPGFCGNCHSLSEEACEDCPNCGISVNDRGDRSCKQGDPASPYYSDEAVDWVHMGKTPSNNCWNFEADSPYNCGYKFPYNKRVIQHQHWATMPQEL